VRVRSERARRPSGTAPAGFGRLFARAAARTASPAATDLGIAAEPNLLAVRLQSVGALRGNRCGSRGIEGGELPMACRGGRRSVAAERVRFDPPGGGGPVGEAASGSLKAPLGIGGHA